MSLDHLNSAFLILATLALGGAIAGLLAYCGVIGWALATFGRVVRVGVTAGFRAWVATLSWADWKATAVLTTALLTFGLVAEAFGLPWFALPATLGLAAVGVVTALAYMYLSFERYEVARGYKAVHNPLKGQELAHDVARYGDRVGVPLMVVAAVGTVLGFALLNYALYGTFGEHWFRLSKPDERAGFLDFLAYALVQLLRIVDVLDLAESRKFLSVSVVKPALWPASALLMAFKSFFTLVLLQQVFASVREGKLLAETVNDFWSPHAPIHDRARSALPQFGPTALRPILTSLKSLGSLNKEQRDQLPVVLSTIGPAAVPALLRHADDPHEPTRGVVARALGLLRVPEATGPLMVLAGDESEVVRAAAAEALGLIAEAASRAKAPARKRPAKVPRWRGRIGWVWGVTAAGIVYTLPAARRWVVAAEGEPAPPPEATELIPACVAALRRAAGDPSAVVRAEAIDALGRVGEPAADAAPELVAALSADADETRRRAAVAIGRVKAAAAVAVPPLAGALQDTSPAVRAAAAAALGEYGEAARAAVPALVGLLQDREEEVRAAAAAAVGKVGVLCEESTQALVEGLASDDTVVRARTAEALGTIGEMAGDAAPALVEALEDDNDRVRAKAVEALGKMGESVAEVAVPKLTRMLRDDDDWVRALAAEALGQMGESAEDAAPALLRSLRHPNPLVRANAAEALGRLKADAARAALEEACGDADAGVRARAVEALAGLGEQAASSLRVVLDRMTDPDPQVRAAAVAVVGGWPGATVDPAVFNGLLDDGNDEVAVRAIRLAPSLSSVEAILPALKARLTGAPNPLVQAAAATALGRIGPAAADAGEELAAAAREGDSELRLAAMRALALVQPPQAAGAFAAGLRDPDPKIRVLASAGLMKVAELPEDAVPAVVEALRDPDDQVRANAAHVLGRLDPVPAEAVPDLVENTARAHDGLRVNAATALRRAADPSARDALHRLLADPNPRVRLVAAGSLATPLTPPTNGGPAPLDPEVRAVLAGLLRDPGPRIQSITGEVVRSLGLTAADLEGATEPLPHAEATPTA